MVSVIRTTSSHITEKYITFRITGRTGKTGHIFILGLILSNSTFIYEWGENAHRFNGMFMAIWIVPGTISAVTAMALNPFTIVLQTINLFLA